MVAKRTSKAEWLEKALEVFEAEGVDGVKIDRLARLLETSRSGFYWHFNDRQDLLTQMLEYWKREFTEVVIESLSRNNKLSPEDRMTQIHAMVEKYGFNRYEVSMRSWSEHDEEAKKVVYEVYAMRFKFIKSIFADMGFKGSELDLRARLWLCYTMYGKSIFGPLSDKKLAEMLKQSQKVLT